MKLTSPRPIYLEGHREEAILLLHSFTGTIRDVKPLAQALHKQGFTCYAPNYRGHGLPLTELIAFDINDWWHDAQNGYKFLQQQGYKQIYVTGVSLGGLLTLKIAETYPVAKIAVMSAPHQKAETGIAWRMERYGQRMNELQHLSDSEAQKQLNTIKQYHSQLTAFRLFITDIMHDLAHINAEAMVLCGEQDDASYQESAQYIAEHMTQTNKSLTAYRLSKHLMTYGEGSEDVINDIVTFFQS
ncbi:alpha/beta fold hydrolase [Staphylococcus lugdunensis]|nr:MULTISPECIES: alpha/beta fold hydrolase [Staphylococcus]AMG61553.1 carboxylesterase [Staphylococcus lugdunensis]ARJ12378.1 carboxylesterase [Staphylococcus lugdunensis]ARJ14873.1 carboxylesterase [Staphylococcus lugdunensis]AST61463.1 carboxylesterase [Staphylococcus lugdunensis]ATG69799.1 carboxylesterase [Staphylococcus lugdunensis]